MISNIHLTFFLPFIEVSIESDNIGMKFKIRNTESLSVYQKNGRGRGVKKEREIKDYVAGRRMRLHFAKYNHANT